ncbi:hypothetical protein Cgig2_001626 [Carnegiea gigantea]|uniref:SAC domain-containing protein n=1 Tax=Carnegiea gigantea TaxID=171969 RepID=A0A9Q1GZB5_9CARY|nr:hypothetical protein Cgig2_001626 [Carnegiea gigantea]
MEKAGSRQKLYTRMRLWEFPNEYVIEPTDGLSDSFLVVSRVDGSMKLRNELPQCNSIRVPKIQTIYGSYLFVITDRENIGSYLGYPVFKVSSMKILPCDLSLRSSLAEQRKIESECSALLKAAERTHGLFFSYDANLTQWYVMFFFPLFLFLCFLLQYYSGL